MLDTVTFTSANCTEEIDDRANFSFIWSMNEAQLSFSIINNEKLDGSLAEATNTLFEVDILTMLIDTLGALSRRFLISLQDILCSVSVSS